MNDATTIHQDADVSTLPARVQELFKLKGQIVTLTTVRDCKVYKGNSPVAKQSKFQCRVGVDYNNIANVQAKREMGLAPATPQPLPWGKWVLFPYVIEHKGNFYFRCTTMHNANSVHEVNYFQNGKEISREKAQQECTAAEFREGSGEDVFVVKVESIVAINGQAV
jgi:hypothetical protein